MTITRSFLALAIAFGLPAITTADVEPGQTFVNATRSRQVKFGNVVNLKRQAQIIFDVNDDANPVNYEFTWSTEQGVWKFESYHTDDADSRLRVQLHLLELDGGDRRLTIITSKEGARNMCEPESEVLIPE